MILQDMKQTALKGGLNSLEIVRQIVTTSLLWTLTIILKQLEADMSTSCQCIVFI